MHHIRPRFKSQIEDVIIFMGTSIAHMKPSKKLEFDKELDKKIRMFPCNTIRTEKTIRNWRTEISSLFGFVMEMDNGNVRAGDNAVMLKENQDLMEFFKYFTYLFQYPGGHMKPEKTLEIIKNGIKFKPAQYIIDVLQTAEKSHGKSWGITREEATHCIFNDLRVTREHQKADKVIERIMKNRKDRQEYDSRGDVVRYAGDILDYMVHANILRYKYPHKYYLNPDEQDMINLFKNIPTWFEGFDKLYNMDVSINDVRNVYKKWFLYVNSYAGKIRFNENRIKTQLLQTIKKQRDLMIAEATDAKGSKVEALDIKPILNMQNISTKTIGDAGEALAHNHECETLRLNNNKDLIHKIVKLPNNFAMGYDIKSFDSKQAFKHIEVKTTMSRHALRVNSFHLTDNEWDAAHNYGDSYYIYRISIFQQNEKASIRLCVVKNPVQEQKNGNLEVSKNDGVDIILRSKAGEKVELLQWKK